MSIDKFGRRLINEKIRSVSSRGPPGVGFKTTADGQYDIDNKRLCNIADPQEPNDAVSLKTLEIITRQAFAALEHAMTKAFEESIRLTLDALESKLNARIDREHSHAFQEDQRIWSLTQEKIKALTIENKALENRLTAVANNVEKLSQHDYIRGISRTDQK